MTEFLKETYFVPDDLLGQRLDKALAKMLDGQSRSTLQTWIKNGWVLVDEETPAQKDKVLGGEQIEVFVPQISDSSWEAQDIPLEVMHEDDELMVVNKPAGLVVHPGAGNPDQTLLNGLLYRNPELAQLPRAGIVHRLDKDTSGLMVVAKSEIARLSLIEQLSDHSLFREYIALVHGRMISGGTVDEPIARDKNDRRKMAVNMLGKPAVTHYRISERYRNHTLVQVQLETGRTHQIRVHMQHLGFSLVGDPVYGRRLAIAGDCHPQLEAELRSFRRQALHALRIAYQHPVTGQQERWECEIPDDLERLLRACAEDRAEHD